MTSPVAEHFDRIAAQYDHFKQKNWYYYRNLKALYRELIPPGMRVLEIGCGTGDLISVLEAREAVGVDISPQMVALAQAKHPAIRFFAGTVESYRPDTRFDYIFLADVIEHLEDIPSTVRALAGLADERTRIVFTYANPLWEPILMLLEKLRLKMPEGPHYRIPYYKFRRICAEEGLRTVDRDWRLIFPASIPGFSDWLNRVFRRVPGVRRLGMLEYVVLQHDLSAAPDRPLAPAPQPELDRG